MLGVKLFILGKGKIELNLCAFLDKCGIDVDWKLDESRPDHEWDRIFTEFDGVVFVLRNRSDVEMPVLNQLARWASRVILIAPENSGDKYKKRFMTNNIDNYNIIERPAYGDTMCQAYAKQLFEQTLRVAGEAQPTRRFASTADAGHAPAVPAGNTPPSAMSRAIDNDLLNGLTAILLLIGTVMIFVGITVSIYGGGEAGIKTPLGSIQGNTGIVLTFLGILPLALAFATTKHGRLWLEKFLKKTND